jgi:hypothetical protein
MFQFAPVFQRLEVPSFDLTWLSIDDVTGESVVLVPGGGGSTKSGLNNMIQIGKVIEAGKGGFTMMASFDTDVKGKSILCSGVAVGACMGHNVVCAFLENYCSILKVSMEEVEGASEPQMVLKRVADFKADFSKQGSVNCACILPSGHIVTGGDDGVCRLWAVGYNKSKPTMWQVKLLNQMEGHTAPIMAVSYHPNDALISTAAKDGSCKIWNVVSGKMVCDVPCLPGLPGAGPVSSTSQMECRGCCFSNDGNYLFAIQSARRGATHLVEWELHQFDENGEDEMPGTPVEQTPEGEDVPLRTAVNVSVSRTMMVVKVPSTRLKICDSGTFLAVGGSDGTVAVIDVETFQIVSTTQCHDLPVTGLGFAPTSTAKRVGAQELLASCSADNKLVSIKVAGGLSACAKFTFIVLSIVCMTALLVFMLIFFAMESPRMLSDKEL